MSEKFIVTKTGEETPLSEKTTLAEAKTAALAMSAGEYSLKKISDAVVKNAVRLYISTKVAPPVVIEPPPSSGYEFPVAMKTKSSAALVITRTIETLRLFWKDSGGSDDVRVLTRFRQVGGQVWSQGFDLLWDGRSSTTKDKPTLPQHSKEYRGLITYLFDNAEYEVQVLNPKTGVYAEAKARTHPAAPKIGEVIRVPAGSSQYKITKGGSPGSYVQYLFEGPIDVKGAAESCIDIDPKALYIDLVKPVCKGPTRHCIYNRQQDDGKDEGPLVYIRDFDLSNFGSMGKVKPFGRNLDSGIGTPNGSNLFTERMAAINGIIYDPNFDSNDWTEYGAQDNYHPDGPQGISIYRSKRGLHTFKNVTVCSRNGMKFNDGFGSTTGNFSLEGPHHNSDIIDCLIMDCCDDSAEYEGQGTLTLVRGCYSENTYMGIANASCSVGPMYMVDTIIGYTKKTDKDKSMCDGDANKNRITPAGGITYGGGHMFWIHCTVPYDAVAKKGCKNGLRSNEYINLHVLNCIITTTGPNIAGASGPTNEVDGLLYNTSIDTPASKTVNAIKGSPKFLLKNGNAYALADDSPGKGKAKVVPGFTRQYIKGVAPDFGAIQPGEPKHVYGRIQ